MLRPEPVSMTSQSLLALASVCQHDIIILEPMFINILSDVQKYCFDVTAANNNDDIFSIWTYET